MDSSNILIDILDEIEIDVILDDNNGSSIKTNFEKIKNNIDIIKNLYYNNIYNNISNDISINFQNLRTLITSKKHSCDVNTTNYISYYKQIKQILGLIICNIYRNSDYHILMANIPDIVYDNTNTDTNTNTINYVNSEVIFDTVEKYIGLDTIVNVFQVSEHNYLVRFKSYDDSIKTCNMLNKMQIGENIIKVELLCKKPYSLKTEPEPEADAKPNPEPEPEPEADAKPNPEPEPDTKTELDAEPEPDAKIEDNIVESQYIVEDIKTANVEEYIKSVNIEAEIAEIAQKQKYSNILVVNIAYGIYNKVSNIVNYFRR